MKGKMKNPMPIRVKRNRNQPKEVRATASHYPAVLQTYSRRLVLLGLLTVAQVAMAGWRLPPGRVVFASTPVGDPQSYICVVKTDGTERLVLASGASLNDPRCSPDGRKVLFSQGATLWMVDAAGTNLQYLTSGRQGEWSPDGHRIVFNRSDTAFGYQVYLMDVDGGNVIRVTSDPSRNATRPVFQPPSGARIYFSSTRDGVPNSCVGSVNQAIYACGLDGGNLVRITSPSYQANQVHFAPDGTCFVCMSDKDIACVPCGTTWVAQLIVFRADGSTSQQVTDAAYRHTKPRWRGDGQKLVCQAAEVCEFGNHAKYQVWTVDADGSNFVPLTDPNVEIADGPDWTWVYKFSGFLPPIAAASGSSFKLGSVIPVKFVVYDPDGQPVRDAVARLYVQAMPNPSIAARVPGATAFFPEPVNAFRWATDHYQFNLNTRADWASAGTWKIHVQLDDGTCHDTTILLE